VYSRSTSLIGTALSLLIAAMAHAARRERRKPLKKS
jgi:hypothetical protein